jgi:hypothetical protein
MVRHIYIENTRTLCFSGAKIHDILVELPTIQKQLPGALFSIMSISDELPRKGLKIAHINICSLRNKVHEIHNFPTSDNIHVLAINLMIHQ